MTDDDLLTREYHAAREAYWDAQKEFRSISISEVRRLIPDGVSAVLFDLSDDPTIPRLTVSGCLNDIGVEDDTSVLEDAGVYDSIDQLAADMEAFSWEEADSFLFRAQDRDRFIITKED